MKRVSKMRKKVGFRQGFRLSHTRGDRPARAPCLGPPPPGSRVEVGVGEATVGSPPPPPGQAVAAGDRGPGSRRWGCAVGARQGGRWLLRKVPAQSRAEMEVEREKARRLPWGLSAKGPVTSGEPFQRLWGGRLDKRVTGN